MPLGQPMPRPPLRRPGASFHLLAAAGPVCVEAQVIEKLAASMTRIDVIKRGTGPRARASGFLAGAGKSGASTTSPMGRTRNTPMILDKILAFQYPLPPRRRGG
jgi:hypothetical protein